MGIGGRRSRVEFALLLFLLCLRSGADGCFIGKGDYFEPSQKAVILFDDGIEDLILQVQFEGPLGEFAWLVPTPSRPEVAVVRESTFEKLRRYVFERRERRVHVPKYDYHGYGGFGGPDTQEGVVVYDRKQVGVYDVAVLEADSVDALVAWCEGNGYTVPVRAPRVLRSYVDRGWVFTAMRIHPEARDDDTEKELLAGTIQAVRLTFPTHEATFPLHISSINRGETAVLIYLLAEDTLMHPSLKQRHPPNLEEFLRHVNLEAGERETEGMRRFSGYFDIAHKSYRAVLPSELPLTQAALPRWTNKPMYLVTLEQHFTRESMVEDVVFKAPEQFDRETQRAYISKRVDAHFDPKDPLLLRMPDALVEVIEANFDLTGIKSFGAEWDTIFPLLLTLDDERRAPLLRRAARQSDSAIGGELLHALNRYWFTKKYDCMPHDRVEEDKNCKKIHTAAAANPNEALSCHYRLEALYGADGLAATLSNLFLTGKGDLEIAKMLAALDTEESLGVLVDAALGRGVDSSARGQVARQEMALMALRHVNHKELIPIYHQLFNEHRDSLNERELSACLVGLWTINDPASEALARQVEAHCRATNNLDAAELANNLLVNRLRTRAPQVNEGMTLAQLEQVMGGPGEVLSKMKVAGVDAIRYRWAAGVATVKGDVVVNWKPGDRS